jgi:hypothetical protein
VRRDREQHCDPPSTPREPFPAVEGTDEENEREEGEEEEEAVHPCVDTVEEEHPAACDERRCDERSPPVGKSSSQECDKWEARHRERCRDDPQAAEAEAEVCDGVGEQEMEWGTAAFPGHVLDDPGQAVAPDEERERLVLVRWPRHQLVLQERRCGDRDCADTDPEGVGSQVRARRNDQLTRAWSRFRMLCHRHSDSIFAGRLAP